MTTLFAAMMCAGCSPPHEPSDSDFAIVTPLGDPGRLTSGPIPPPMLIELGDLHRVRNVAMNRPTQVDGQLAEQDGGQDGDAIQLVRQIGDTEVIPTPKPDAPHQPAALGPEPRRIDAISRQPTSPGSRSLELIPTPEPDPAVPTGSDATQASQPSQMQAVGNNIELVEVTEGRPPLKTADLEISDDGVGPEDYRSWPLPQVALVVTGQQHGYIEPCGCTGLDRQKGGVARRYTFLRQLRDQGWDLVPIDAGDQVRRFGRQAEMKLQQSVRALKEMDYQAVGFGPNDLRLGVGELLAVAAGDTPDDTMFASANVVLIDPELMPQLKLIERNGRRIGVTSILDPEFLENPLSDEIVIEPTQVAAEKAIAAMKSGGADFKVLMFFGEEEAAKKLVLQVPGFDLVVAAGGYGEPTFRPESFDGSETKMIVCGNKGMYAGVVGLYSDQPFKYARVPLTDAFEDAPEMRRLMADYQEQLRVNGLDGLGLLPAVPHSSGQKFVGSAKCGECHTSAMQVWQDSPHALATAHIVKPPRERGDIARHFDPECLSCHVTGWNPQEYFPYESGYLSLEQSNHLTGNGCENCHGPGSEHSSAEAEGSAVAQELRDQLRDEIKLSVESVRDKCIACHDLDNSPDFHEPDAFLDVYWPMVEHYGMD